MKNIKLLLVSLCGILSFSIYADRVTVHNRTPRDLYIGIYYIGTEVAIHGSA